MITHFLSWKQPTNILDNARAKLKGSLSDIRIGDGLSKEGRESRLHLYPAMQAVCDNDKAVSLRYDILRIDKKPYVVGNNDHVVP